MKKPEQIMWSKFQMLYRHLAVFQRHEDRYSPDVPDVSYVTRDDGKCGWVELKTVVALPSGNFRLSHLRPGQVNWLSERGALGADVWLLIWVQSTDEWLWFHGSLVDHWMHERGALSGHWREISSPFPL